MFEQKTTGDIKTKTLRGTFFLLSSVLMHFVQESCRLQVGTVVICKTLKKNSLNGGIDTRVFERPCDLWPMKLL